MKILFVIPNLNVGGAQSQTISQANGLASLGHEIHLAIFSDQIPLLSNLTKKVQTHLFQLSEVNNINPRLLMKNKLLSSKLVKVMRKIQPEVILGILPAGHFITRLAFKKAKINTRLWQYHHSTEFAIHPFNTLPKRIFHKYNNHLAKNDYGHIYISKAVKNDIEQNVPVKRGEVLYNAIPYLPTNSGNEESIQAKYSISKGEYFIIPGRLHPVKGHVFFLNSTHDLLKESGHTLVIAGYGHTESDILSTSDKYELNDNIIITGEIENLEMLSLIEHARLCIIPSLQEGLGNVAIESLMVGTTALCSDAGGLPEVINHKQNGYLFKAGDNQSLREAFNNVLNGDYPLLSKSILQQSYAENFSLPHHLNRLQAIICS